MTFFPLGQSPTVIQDAELPILLNPVFVKFPTYQQYAGAYPDVVWTVEAVIGGAGVFEKATGKTTDVLSVNPPWSVTDGNPIDVHITPGCTGSERLKVYIPQIAIP